MINELGLIILMIFSLLVIN